MTAQRDLNFVHLRPRRSAPRVADRVAHQIALELLDGEFEPGRRLPPERELMLELGASRQALRGALRLLEAWGLISVKMGRDGGPIIRRPEPSDMTDQLGVLIQHENATMTDVFLARRAIEPIMAHAAATNASDEQIAELEAVLDHMATVAVTETSYEQYQADAVRVGGLLGEMAGLVILAYFLDSITLITNAWIMPQLPFDEDRRLRLLKNNSAIAEAIRNRDPEGARDASLRARLESENYWLQRLPELATMPIAGFTQSALDPMSIVPPATA